MKILHIGNIANNAYLNSKLLRQKGIESDVLCYDYYHIMGCPEWEETKLEGNWGDDFNPDWSKLNLGDFKRPKWFYQGVLDEVVLKKKISDPSQVSFNKKLKIRYKEFLYRNYTNFVFAIFHRYPRLRSIVLGFTGTISYLYLRYRYFIQRQLNRSQSNNDLDVCHRLIGEFRSFFPHRKDKLTMKDILTYYPRAKIFKEIFSSYDLVQAYGTDVIWPMLAGFKPYIGFEHGSIRDYPFEKSAFGRLTALAYKKADLVFITNSDALIAAKKLGLKNFVPIPHPILSDWHKKLGHFNKHNPQEVILFCPMRHDWQIKGIDLYIQSFPEVIRKSHRKVKIIFNDFGMDVDKSRKLLKNLGLEKNIEWHKPMPRWQLVYWMIKADIILDQLNSPAFGGIAAEGLQAGKPVLASYNDHLGKWMFPQKPPLVIINAQEEIAKNLVKLINHRPLREKLGQEGKKWFNRYLSEKIVLKTLIKSYDKLL